MPQPDDIGEVFDDDAAADQDPLSAADAGLALGIGKPAGAGSDAGPLQQSPLQMLQTELAGDYWMRADSSTKSSALGIQVKSDTTVYSLVQVGFDQAGQFKMFDRQCFVTIKQDGGTSTTFRDEGQRSFVPAQRTLTVNDVSGSWSAGACPYAVGWSWDFAQGDHVLPSSDADPLVSDPDGGGKGLNIAINSNIGVRCSLRVVQRIDVTYEGMLLNRAFGAGTMTLGNSQQNILQDNCPDAPTSMTVGTPTVRLVKSPTPIDAGFSCPTLGAMQQALL